MKQTRDLGMNHEHLPWLVLAGVASPIILFVASMAVAAVRSIRTFVKRSVSWARGGRPGAIWMNWLGIVPAGFLIPVCAPSLYCAFGRGRRSATGSTLLGAGG